MRVSELAKDSGKTSKEVITILENNGVTGKKPQSGLDDQQIVMIKKVLQGGTSRETSKNTEIKNETTNEVAPKKKKIIVVSNPQHSKMQGQSRGGERKQANKVEKKPAPSAQEVKDAFNAALGIEKTETKVEVKATETITTAQSKKTTEVVSESVVSTQQSDQAKERPTTTNNRQDGDRPAYNNNNRQGGDRPAYNNNR
ncbi:MAG: translation initiation factor IF-2 N-terminal domain-containing protein, partial [Eubacteriales bacterium]